MISGDSIMFWTLKVQKIKSNSYKMSLQFCCLWLYWPEVGNDTGIRGI